MTRTHLWARVVVVAAGLALVASLAFAAAGATAQAQHGSAQHSSARHASTPLSGGLAVSGNHLINTATSQPVQLRGVNRSGTEYACIQGWGIFDGPSDAASVQAIASWGANVVRVPINEDCWLGINGVNPSYGGPNYQSAIEQYVSLLHQNGLYAEITLMWTAPGTQQATSNPQVPDQDHAPTAWQSMATAFKGDPAVYFGLLNEPHGVNWSCWLNGGSSCNGQVSFTAAGAQELVNTIRGTGANNVIAYQCLDWSNTCSGWLSNHPTDPAGQLIAEAHVYGGNGCADTNCFNSTYAPIAAQFPMVWGEVGESYDASDCGSANMQQFLPWADAHGVGYQAWTWDTWGTCLSLISDYNGTPANAYGTYVQQHLQALAGGGGGGGGSPSASLSPTSLSFGNQQVGTTSSAQTITLSNSGNAALSISGISLTGTNPGDYAQTNTCGSSLAAGANCAINVTFTPAATGARSATVSVSDNAAGSPQQATLSGTGTAAPAPAVSLSPTSLAFGNQPVNTTSAAKTITLSNTGNAALTINSIGVTGTNASDFAQTNTCGSSVAAGATCTIDVTFTPAATGSSSAAVSISDNAVGSPQSAPLAGTGTPPPAPAVSLSPTRLSFGDQQVNTTSAAKTITLSNTGNAPLTVNGISLGGTNATDFAQTNSCGSSVAAGATCTIDVTFTPTTTGNMTAAVSISDNAQGSPQQAALTGTGVPAAPAVSLAPSSLSFGNQQEGTQSSPQTITLSNSGNASLTISSIGITGSNASDFTQTNTCPATVAAGATCTISVVFAPASTGSKSAAVNVTDNAATSPQSAALSGTGTAPPAPSASLSPSSLSFGDQQVNTTSAAKTITLSNTGNASLTITSLGVIGTDASDFAQTNTCGSSVAAGSTCTIDVTFTPAATGARSAAVNIADNAASSPQQATLSGTGVAAPAPTVSLSPTSLSFGNQQVGTTSASKTITLSNTGNAPLSISGISIGGTNAGDFAQTNTCGSSVAAGATCTIDVTFAPAATGARSAAVSVSDDAAGSPQQATLSGTGTPAPAPVASLNPTSLSFGNQQVGGQSAPKAITLSNTGNAMLGIKGISIGGANAGDFAQSNTCGNSLAAGSSCTISVVFAPHAAGDKSAAVSVSDDAAGSPQQATLAGTGVAAPAPVASLSPTSLSFGNQQVGTTSPSQTITLSNSGNAPLSITGMTLGGTNTGAFAETTTCPATVAAGGSCAIDVTFAPQSTGGKSAAVNVSDNDAGGSQSAALSGMGEAPPGGGTSFSDGFESGSFSAWTTTRAGHHNSVTVESNVVHSGRYAMLAHKALGGDGDALVEKAFAAQSKLDVRAYFDLTDVSGHGEVHILSLYSQDGRFLGWVDIVANAHSQQGDEGNNARLYYYTGTYHRYDCGAAPTFGAWHSIEVQDTVSGSGNGGFTVWVDGARRCGASGISTAEQSDAGIARAMFGSVDSERSIGLDIYIDDVKIAQDYIGG